MEIAFSSSFKKKLKKKIKGDKALENKFWQYVKIFIKNPFNRKLRTHKLSGKLIGLWSFSIEFDLEK